MASPLEAFGELLARDDAKIDLAHACLLIAQDAYPRLEVERYLGDIERMALRLRGRTPQSLGAEERVAALNEFLFEDLGYRGNTEEYYDPRNSYLNDVLDRRLGIPITLSLVYMEIGRRVGLPLSGVGMPAHFIVAYEARGPDRLLVDPFNCGRLLSLDECQRLVQQVHGGSARLEQDHLAPSTPRQILVRILTNLKLAYQRQGDFVRALRVSEQISVVSPNASELRDRGFLRFRVADFRGAEADLSSYLEFAPGAGDAEAVQRQLALIRELRARRN
jgi:regulator of sirC expression with transglutaminase-like and TPR domain